MNPPHPPHSPRYAELAGRVAVVTGAAKGIGQGIAMRLGAEGMRVVLADKDEASLQATTGDLQPLGAEEARQVHRRTAPSTGHYGPNKSPGKG